MKCPPTLPKSSNAQTTYGPHRSLNSAVHLRLLIRKIEESEALSCSQEAAPPGVLRRSVFRFTITLANALRTLKRCAMRWCAGTR